MSLQDCILIFFTTNYMFVVNILYLLCTSLDSLFYRYKFYRYNFDNCVPLQSANERSKYVHEMFLFSMINLGTIISPYEIHSIRS